MLLGHTTASYNEIVSIAISSDDKYRQHKEAKKRKNMIVESSGDSAQHQRIVYQPVHHFHCHLPQQQSPAAVNYLICYNSYLSTPAKYPWYSFQKLTEQSTKCSKK